MTDSPRQTPALWAARNWRVLRARLAGALSPESMRPVAPTMPAAPASGPFEQALEALGDPVLIVTGGVAADPTDRYGLFANAAARQFLRGPVEGARLVNLIRDPDVLAAVDAALFERREAQATFEQVGAAARVLRTVARPLGDSGGRAVALLVMTDQTEGLRNEQARVDFLANASHELRTPLASLSGFIETLRGHARDDVAARDRFLDIMQAQAERMSRLVNDLTSLSRIELLEHVAPSDCVDLATAVRDVLDALAPVAKARDTQLEAEVAEAARPTVAGDRDQIIQVIQNLVENAIKYTPAGGVVRVRVEVAASAAEALRQRRPHAVRLTLLTPDHEADPCGVVRVEDAGLGIAREHLPRLTERFYRVEGQKSGERLGTGLGLAIVKHIVNRHRGGLAVESTPDEGAAFTICLPLQPTAGV